MLYSVYTFAMCKHKVLTYLLTQFLSWWLLRLEFTEVGNEFYLSKFGVLQPINRHAEIYLSSAVNSQIRG